LIARRLRDGRVILKIDLAGKPASTTGALEIGQRFQIPRLDRASLGDQYVKKLVGSPYWPLRLASPRPS
jgi:hypothetical protein